MSPLTNKSTRARVYSGIIILTGIFLTINILSMRRDCATFDEGHHLAAGYFYLQGDTPVFSPHHPPLVDVISALPLLAISIKPPLARYSFTSTRGGDIMGFFFFISRKLLYRSSPGADTILFWARLPNILLGLLLAGTVFQWSRRLYGPAAGLAALFLCVFSPDIIANSHLVTNDLGSVFFIFLSFYLLRRALISGRPKHYVFLGLASGAALASKYTAVIIFPISFLLAALFLISTRNDQVGGAAAPRRKAGALFSRLLLAAGLALAVVALIYQVRYFPRYWEGLSAAAHRALSPGSYFLCGHYSKTGWRYYYILTFLLKTPLALFVLLAIAALGGRKITPRGGREEFFLLLPPALYFIIACLSRINIGNRHILLVYPFLFVFAGKVMLPRRRSWVRVALFLLFGWYGLSSLLVFPHYLAYFNELAGGPQNGYKYLSDSNVDWGQDLKRLKEFMMEKKIKGVILSYFGEADPSYYGINYQWALSDGPLPYREFPVPLDKKYLAISVKCLQGVSFPDHSVYRWLDDYRPYARVGPSIFIYDLTGKAGALLKLARIYRLTGRRRLAKREARDVLKIDPSSRPARMMLEELNAPTR